MYSALCILQISSMELVHLKGPMSVGFSRWNSYDSYVIFLNLCQSLAHCCDVHDGEAMVTVMPLVPLGPLGPLVLVGALVALVVLLAAAVVCITGI